MKHICEYKTNDSVTVILKMVDYCNFDCSFCRYPSNKHHSTMSFETYKTIVFKACEYNKKHGNPRLSIIYHGGEPLLWGLKNYKLAIDFQSELKEKIGIIHFRNSIQTNGSLLNQEWIDFFKENSFNIGISIDGPDEINFHKKKGCNQTILNNLKLLNDNGCNFGILSVITNQHIGWADKYYDFLVQNNIHSVGFCYCIYDEDTKETVKNEVLTDFLKRFFDRYYYGNYNLSVREFDSVIRLSLGAKTNACTFSYRSGCGKYFSIQPDGDVFFCDPYTLDKSPIGNILHESFNSIKNKPQLISIQNDARISVDKVCNACEIKEICGGGCYRNLFGGDKNIFCDTFKSVYPHIRDTVTMEKKRVTINNK